MRWKSDKYSGWGRHLWANMKLSRPSRVDAVKAALSEHPGPAIGNSRSYGDAALVSDGHGQLMTRMNRFLEFDKIQGILRAEAGITMREVLDLTLPQGWAPSALPGTGFATLGGCIAMDVHGKDHRSAGSFSAQVLSLTLMTPFGTRKTLSRTSNRALFFATLGGLGQTGVILDASLQLHRASPSVSATKMAFETLEEGMALLDASTARFAVAWIDALATGRKMGRGILETSDYTDANLNSPTKSAKPIPLALPKFAMSRWPVKLFNSARFALHAGGTRDVPFVSVQYPLDELHDWNKLYGKDGFHQFQASFPMDRSADALTALMRVISDAQAASPLVVIKRLGAESEATLGFAQDGFTLAADFQHRKGTETLLKQLNDITKEHGGRIYFAKDSSARPHHVKGAYPEMADWQNVLLKTDPDGKMRTDLVNRLELRP